MRSIARVAPGAADGWDLADAGLRYTFRLRPGLRWSNGQLLEHRLLMESQLPISSFGEDDDGELYLTSYDGWIYQVKGI